MSPTKKLHLQVNKNIIFGQLYQPGVLNQDLTVWLDRAKILPKVNKRSFFN